MPAVISIYIKKREEKEPTFLVSNKLYKNLIPGNINAYPNRPSYSNHDTS
jgi:hypothetical protein